MVLVTLTWPSVAVVVHYWRRMRCSARHWRREATARNEEFNERIQVDQTSHGLRLEVVTTPVGHKVCEA